MTRTLLICLLLIKIIIGLLIFANNVQADQSFGIHVNGFSKHVNPDHDYNEKNYGGGIYYEVNNHFIAAGWYDNSLNRTSKYITTGWRHTFRSGNWELAPGVLVGGITGYDEDSASFVAAPTVSMGYAPVRINLMYLPGLNGFDAVWFAQFEIELWGNQ